MRGLVAPVVRDLLDEHPDLALTLTEREPWDTIDLVASGQQDLGIVHSWGDVPLHVPEHLVGVTIARDVADVIVPRGHRLAGRTRVSPRDLVDEPWVATPDGTICRQWLMRMYDGTGRAPRIAHVAMEFDSHLALVGRRARHRADPAARSRARWRPTSWRWRPTGPCPPARSRCCTAPRWSTPPPCAPSSLPCRLVRLRRAGIVRDCRHDPHGATVRS